jgi:Tfp pilus assembly protein PilF
LRSANAPSSVALAAASAERAAGQPDAAAGLLRNYLVTHPDAADVAATLGTLEIGAKRLEAARVFLEQALARQPNNAAVLNNLAWVNEQLHQPQQARAMAQRAWLLSATPQASDTLGWILLGGDAGPPEPGQSGVALDLLREAAAALPNDPSVQYHYAMALKDNGQTLPAAAILGKLVALPAFDEQPQARKLLDSLPHS